MPVGSSRTPGFGGEGGDGVSLRWGLHPHTRGPWWDVGRWATALPIRVAPAGRGRGRTLDAGPDLRSPETSRGHFRVETALHPTSPRGLLHLELPPPAPAALFSPSQMERGGFGAPSLHSEVAGGLTPGQAPTAGARMGTALGDTRSMPAPPAQVPSPLTWRIKVLMGADISVGFRHPLTSGWDPRCILQCLIMRLSTRYGMCLPPSVSFPQLLI